MLEYAIVFVLTSTSKCAYVRYHRIYMEIRSYLPRTQTFKIRLENETLVGTPASPKFALNKD